LRARTKNDSKHNIILEFIELKSQVISSEGVYLVKSAYDSLSDDVLGAGGRA